MGNGVDRATWAALLRVVVSGCLAIAAAEARAWGADLEATDERALFRELPSVFAASRFDQPANEAPADVTVVTAQDIERYGYRTLADVLRGVRGFSVAYDYNYSYVATRGLGVATDYNTRVLLLLDGRRLNDVAYDAALIGQEQVVDLALVDRIEIIRGPGSSLYGSNALAAVINVITRRGRDLQGAMVRIDGGRNGGAGGVAMVGQRIPGGVEYLLGVSIGRDPGETRLRFTEFTDTPSGGVASDVDTDRWQRAFAKVHAGEIEFAAGFSNRVKTVPTGSYGSLFNDPRNQALDERSFVRATWEHNRGPDARFELRLGLDEYRYSANTWWNADDPTLTRDRTLVRWGTAGLEWGQRFGPHRVVAGAESEWDIGTTMTTTDTLTDGTQVPYVDIRNGVRHRGFYVQDEWRLSEAWLASLGVRYDRYAPFPGEASPRVGLVWQPDADSTLKLLYGRAFRTPNLSELYYFDGTTSSANPALRPERVQTAELVAQRRFGTSVRASAAMHRWNASRLITYDLDRNGLLGYVNQGTYVVHGASLGLEGETAGGAEWRAVWAVNAPRSGNGMRDPFTAPRQVGTVAASTPLGDERLRLSVETLYDAGRHTLTGRRIGGQAQTNVVLLATGLPRGLKARLALYNVLDRRMLVAGGPELLQETLAQPGRALWFTLEAALP